MRVRLGLPLEMTSGRETSPAANHRRWSMSLDLSRVRRRKIRTGMFWKKKCRMFYARPSTTHSSLISKCAKTATTCSSVYICKSLAIVHVYSTYCAILSLKCISTTFRSIRMAVFLFSAQTSKLTNSLHSLAQSKAFSSQQRVVTQTGSVTLLNRKTLKSCSFFLSKLCFLSTSVRRCFRSTAVC